MDTNQKKAIIISAIVISFFIIIFLIIFLFLTSSLNKNNYNPDISINNKSIKQIIENNGCKYIKDYVDSDNEYPIQVELVFKTDLYTDDQSNEKSYMKLIDEIVKFVRYENVKMIDEDKDITIEITCEDGEISSIKINGIEDYFIYMDSQISVSKYEEIRIQNINSTSEVLTTLINTNWDSGINCGTRESIFQNYYIFLDEGIEYKKIGSKIYNIIFNEKYNGDVVNDVRAGDSINSIKLKLGNPAFEDEKLGVIGYKGKDFYAFFNGKEVSVYKNIKSDYSEFWKLVDTFIKENSKTDFKTFMNELTYIWPDYSEYIYNKDSMFISYPNKGIDIKLNYEDENGIIIYNNISENLDKVKKYLSHTEFLSKLQLDNVFEAEKRRINNNKLLDKNCDEFIKSLKDDLDFGEDLVCGESNLFKFYIDKDDNGYTLKTYFISKNGSYANRELTDPIDSYVWISDNFFVYGIKGKGIYCYNTLDGNKQTLVEGQQDFEIKKFEDNTIYYDREEINISF